MRISEAYGTLSSTEKRTKYDRDVLGLHRGSVHHPSGSFSSANPAGGRPATGLSRRRTVFRGPPPSFYRSGGWGAHEAKRSAAQEESTGGASSGNARARDHHNDGSWINENMGGAAGSASSGFGFGADTGGMGPGQDPFHRGDVPHFDRESHEKTQRNTEAHRTRSWRMRMGGRDRIEIETDRGPGGMFFVIGGVLLISFMGPYLFSRSWSEKGKKRGTARS
jgi:curved DNA-binding protein CbpA